MNELDNMISDLTTLVAIPSVYAKSDNLEQPFGKECKSALNAALDMGKRFGFDTVNKNSYGYVEYGDGKECVGALCHLDVVPEGMGWNSPPYTLTIRDGYIYGRGVTDDKGAYIAVLYALKRIKDNGIKLNKRARIILGTNEENGSKCIREYVKNEQMPTCSFVPDADFPIINSEKGILHSCLKIDIANLQDDILGFDGGTALNIVPQESKVVVKYKSNLYNTIVTLSSGSDYSRIFENELLKNTGLDKKDFEFGIGYKQNLIITANGVSAHAMEPHKGDNAIIKMLKFLGVLDDKNGNLWGTLSKILDSANLSLIGLATSCPKSGNLTMTLSKIERIEDTINLWFDSRLPLTVDDKKFESIFVDGLKKYNISQNTTYTTIVYKPNLYISPDAPLIKTLLKVYKKHTGDEGYCIQIGGGTYARELTNAVAFGPQFQNVIVDIHKPNERYAVKDFAKIVDIYCDTFLELCK